MSDVTSGIGTLLLHFINLGIGHLKKKKIYLAGPIAMFSKCGNRAYPKNVAKNTYERGYKLNL